MAFAFQMQFHIALNHVSNDTIQSEDRFLGGPYFIGHSEFD